MSRTTRTATAGALALGGLLLAAGPAAADVFAEETEVAAGASSQVSIIVPHGCEGSPTTKLEIQIPEDIVSVTPAVHPGWDAVAETEALDEPVEGEDETITERTSVVTYTAQPGNELADGFRDTFVLGYQAPDTAGEHLFFKTIQTCAEGEVAWIEEYTGDGEEPEHPSPVVEVVEASEGEGHAHSDEGDSAAAPTDDEDSDSDSNGLAIAALVVGSLGLLAGGAALIRSRQAS